MMEWSCTDPSSYKVIVLRSPVMWCWGLLKTSSRTKLKSKCYLGSQVGIMMLRWDYVVPTQIYYKWVKAPEVKLCGSDTGTCCWLFHLKPLQHFHTDSHQHIEGALCTAMQGADLFIRSDVGFSILPIHTDIQPEQGTTNLLIIGQPTLFFFVLISAL